MANETFLEKMIAMKSGESSSLLFSELDATNKILNDTNAFNENAALQLDAIYNFLSMNRDLFGNQSLNVTSENHITHIDDFFNRNGYIPVKVLNPCCEDKGGIEFPRGNPKGGKKSKQRQPQTVPQPQTNPIPQLKPSPVKPPVFVPPVVTPTPPITTPAPDLIPQPPPVSAPDLIPQTPPVSAPDINLGDPMGSGIEGMNLNPSVAAEPSLGEGYDWAAIAATLGVGAAVLGGILYAPYFTIPALVAGGGVAASASASENTPPNNVKNKPINNRFTPISYSSSNDSTRDMEIKSDEINFESDVIRFVYDTLNRGESGATGLTGDTMLTSASYNPQFDGMSSTGGNMTEISTAGGQTAMVASEYAGNFQGFIDELESTGYKISSLGGQADRNTAKGEHSWHREGMAIDINPGANPHTFPGSPNYGQTDLPANIGEIAKKYGLGWGGNWTSSKDTMHFSIGPNEHGNPEVRIPLGNPTVSGSTLNKSSTITMLNKLSTKKNETQSIPVVYTTGRTGNITAGSDKPVPAMTIDEELLFKTAFDMLI